MFNLQNTVSNKVEYDYVYHAINDNGGDKEQEGGHYFDDNEDGEEKRKEIEAVG